MQLFQDEAATPAAPAVTPAGRLAQGSSASPAAQAILGAIGASNHAAAQQLQQQQVRARSKTAAGCRKAQRGVMRVFACWDSSMQESTYLCNSLHRRIVNLTAA
jgi:hypothetical protein